MRWLATGADIRICKARHLSNSFSNTEWRLNRIEKLEVSYQGKPQKLSDLAHNQIIYSSMENTNRFSDFRQKHFCNLFHSQLTLSSMDHPGQVSFRPPTIKFTDVACGDHFSAAVSTSGLALAVLRASGQSRNTNPQPSALSGAVHLALEWTMRPSLERSPATWCSQQAQRLF